MDIGTVVPGAQDDPHVFLDRDRPLSFQAKSAGLTGSATLVEYAAAEPNNYRMGWSTLPWLERVVIAIAMPTHLELIAAPCY